MEAETQTSAHRCHLRWMVTLPVVMLIYGLSEAPVYAWIYSRPVIPQTLYQAAGTFHEPVFWLREHSKTFNRVQGEYQMWWFKVLPQPTRPGDK
jgi:hypothetical protein